MDNFFKECPARMDDGRLFTDYRTSQIREEIFRYKHCVASENEARTLRIENADEIMDNEWNHLIKDKYCFPRNKCFHQHPITRVTSLYNNAEILAYNGDLPAPSCQKDCHNYRATVTPGSIKGMNNCRPSGDVMGNGYPVDRCPARCSNTKRLLPDGLRIEASDIDTTYNN